MICVIKRDRYFLHLKMHSFFLVLAGTLYLHQNFTKSRCFPVFLLPERKRDCRGCDGVHRWLPFCIRRAGLRDCRRLRAGHVSAQEWRWDTRSCGIYPWCQTSLIHKCCAGGSGPVSCQVWSNFGLTSADIGLKWLQTAKSLKSSWFHGTESEMFPDELLKWNHLKMQQNISRYIKTWLSSLWDTSWILVAAQNKVNMDPSMTNDKLLMLHLHI